MPPLACPSRRDKSLNAPRSSFTSACPCDSKDAAEGFDAIGFLALRHRAGFELAVLVHAIERDAGRVEHEATLGAEVGRRGLSPERADAGWRGAIALAQRAPYTFSKICGKSLVVCSALVVSSAAPSPVTFSPVRRKHSRATSGMRMLRNCRAGPVGWNVGATR